MRLILASASPRRAELLRSAGIQFDVVAADVEETPAADEPAADYTLRVARDKARHVAARHRDAIVIGADTEVVIEGQILGKPRDDPHAAEMLRLLSGTVHDVLTAVVVCAAEHERAEVVTTRVRFVRMTDEEIAWYVRSGEPHGKAGAYAIQGLGARFIDRIEGSWANVVGLPVDTVYRLLNGLSGGGIL
jgi:septum formation protein